MLKDLTAELVRARFTYDLDEGLLRYRNPMSIRCVLEPAATIAGRIHIEGYRYITVNKKQYRASRLIWLYVTGEWPPNQVDHIDRNTGNDKWNNLRLANSSQNKANCGKKKLRSDGSPFSSSLKGVQAVQKRKSIRYRAIATVDGIREHLGYFDTEEEAHAAYLKRAKELHGEFASDGKPPD